MSTLDYRDWELWLNSEYFKEVQSIDGYFECVLHNSLMVNQSVVFLAEDYEILNRQLVKVDRRPQEVTLKDIQTSEGELCIRLYELLDLSKEIQQTIYEIKLFIDSLAIAIDAPLSCYSIRFISQHSGKILHANRKQIRRGFSFRIEERSLAKLKLETDLKYFQDKSDPYLVAGQRHYMTGMQLLSLEDFSSGLIDAAFMQFYQGCEVLCRDKQGALNESKKYIASKNAPDSKNLQIIAHQIWRVRNKYFGHGDVRYNLLANQNRVQATMVANQVLIARYLCRRLIDINSPSNEFLIREMGLYFAGYSGNFNGEIKQLLEDFNVPFDGLNCIIFSPDGTEHSTFDFTLSQNSC